VSDAERWRLQSFTKLVVPCRSGIRNLPAAIRFDREVRNAPGGQMISVLFVDDDANVGAGQQRTLRSMRALWDMRFALSGIEALEMMRQAPVDVIVTDMRMPGMDGSQLLTEVVRRHPEIVRIVLSGQCDRQAALSAVGPAHLFLSKPCDSFRLIEVIQRVYRLRSVLAGSRVANVVSGMGALPSPPKLQLELRDAFNAAEPSVQAIAEIIGRDMALTAKLLQLVNSAFFGAHWRAATALQAVHLLGTELVQTLVLSFGIIRQLELGMPAGAFNRCLQNGMQTAAAARIIAGDLGLTKRAIDEAFTAGLLHDVGRLILSTSFVETDREIAKLCREEGAKRCDIERQRLGATHAEIGAYLLALWGLPDPIIEATAFHHAPDGAGRMVSVTTAVHAACALISGVECALDEEYLEAIGLTGRLAGWKAALGTQADECAA
jgi:HD-like signal output (HDOD) protein